MPSHHWFHYTDVPVVRVEKYAEGQAGRSKWDVVHMIPYCVEVLRGRVPEQNERKITKPVASFCWPIMWATFTSRCMSARSISTRRVESPIRTGTSPLWRTKAGIHSRWN